MYRLKMNDVPADVRRRICEQLDLRGLESVHMVYGSIFSEDTKLFEVIARPHEPQNDHCCYVYSLHSEKNELYREREGLTYAGALMEMGYRINE